MAGVIATPADMINVLKDHGFDDYDDNRFLVIINQVQNTTCAIETWPFLEKSFTSVCTPTNGVLQSLPSDFTAMLSVVNTTTGNVLVPERWDVINKSYSVILTQVAEPQYYYFKGDVPQLMPVPDTTYSLLCAYMASATTLTTTSDAFTWPLRHIWVIVYGCLSKLFEMEDDDSSAAYYQQAYANTLSAAREDIWSRQFDRPDRIADVSGDDDYWYN